MSKIKLLFILCLSLGCLSSFGQTPTWSNKIAAIFYANCTNCHRPGGIGTFPLLTYTDAFSHSLTIRDQVVSKLMPPWKPNPDYKHFKDERYLSSADISAITDWVNNGTPVGDLSTAPAVPTYPVGSQMLSIDQSLQLPKYTVNSTIDEYRSFVIHGGSSANRYLNEIEYLPGNGSIVHHIVLFKDPSNYSDSLDQLDTIPGFSSYGSIAVSPNAQFLGAWAPGSGIFKIPSNFGTLVDANSDYVVEVHYAPGSAGQQDSSIVNLKYTTEPSIREVFIDPILNYFTSMTNGPIRILPNAINTYYEREFIPTGYDFSILAIFPHMHKVGTSFKVWNYENITHDTVPIIEIPKWDFHWQGFYTMQKLMKIPGNSSLQAKAQYDNTSANHDNPFSPPQLITEGEHTTQEMMLAFFAYTQYRTGDENIILDSTVLANNICVFEDGRTNVMAYPNPVSEELNISLSTKKQGVYQFELCNMNGQILEHVTKTANEETYTNFQMDMQNYEQGIYLLNVTDEAGNKKVIRIVKL